MTHQMANVNQAGTNISQGIRDISSIVLPPKNHTFDNQFIAIMNIQARSTYSALVLFFIIIIIRIRTTNMLFRPLFAIVSLFICAYIPLAFLIHRNTLWAHISFTLYYSTYAITSVRSFINN
jgi:hypothetical protein